MFDVATGVLASALATSGTITVSYPTGRTRGDYFMGSRHFFVTDSGAVYASPNDFELTFNTTASGITVTWRNAATIPAGTAWRLEIDGPGANVSPLGAHGDLQRAFQGLKAISGSPTAFGMALAGINLGSPAAAVSTAAAASQSVTGGVAATLNGTLASSGVVTFDVPRNVVAAWTNTTTVLFTGTDINGTVMSEISASGTSHTGKKAFKTITSIVPVASVTGFTAGTGTVLGLPILLDSVSFVLREIMDGATATAGTLVKADLTKPTTATGDVRGTYAPNSAPDGSRAYFLVAALGSVRRNAADGIVQA
jgi:hypothetical protein